MDMSMVPVKAFVHRVEGDEGPGVDVHDEVTLMVPRPLVPHVVHGLDAGQTFDGVTSSAHADTVEAMAPDLRPS